MVQSREIRANSSWVFSAVLAVLGTVLFGAMPVSAADRSQRAGAVSAATPSDCPKCAEWTASQKPFKVYGNTYYVGTHALSSILITSPGGHVLIDGTVQEAASQVAANIRALGFRVEDVRFILNSHVHFDHAGGIAALQKMSAAQVAASAPSAHVLMQGHADPDDPQFGSLLRGLTPIEHVRIIKDGETITVGRLALTAYLTPGHTPGGTSWTWASCVQASCLRVVYADSLSAISAEGFQFSHSPTYPGVLQDFAKSFAILSTLPCDILLTPHPEFSSTFERLRKRDSGANPNAFVDSNACHRYADAARSNLNRRLEQEKHPQQH
jgi:metallo-beta-lactamase class B